jgi:CheY-like chemotaxis protein
MSPSRAGSVLVVDDDADLRIGLCEILVEEGYSVASAVDGADALAHLSEPAMPDIVLLDLRMPNMDGYAFLERRSTSPKLAEIPVIVISATPAPAGMGFPIAGVLTKPVDLLALLLMMKREVHGRASAPRTTRRPMPDLRQLDEMRPQELPEPAAFAVQPTSSTSGIQSSIPS